MPEPTIVLLDAVTLTRENDIDFSPIDQLGSFTSYNTTPTDEICSRIEQATIILTNKTHLGPTEIAEAPQLKLICVCATGVNNVDLDFAREHGITVCNVTGYSTPSVAQHTIGLLLNLAANLHTYAAEPTEWAKSPFFCRLDHAIVELAGRNLGLAGAGAIGTAVGNIAQSLGMTIQVLGRSGKTKPTPEGWERLGKKEFFRTSDAVTLHCPLTEETHHLINSESLALMQPGSFLVNTGRGDLVDELALIDALRSHHLAGAALDVLSAEPPPAHHPLLDPSIPNLLITPHSAWASTESRRRLLDGVAKNIESFLEGSPANVVT